MKLHFDCTWGNYVDLNYLWVFQALERADQAQRTVKCIRTIKSLVAPPRLLEQVCEPRAVDNLHRVVDVGTADEQLLRRLLTPEPLELIQTETGYAEVSSAIHPGLCNRTGRW